MIDLNRFLKSNNKNIGITREPGAVWGEEFLTNRIEFLQGELINKRLGVDSYMTKKSLEVNKEILNIIRGGKNVLVYSLDTCRRSRYSSGGRIF